jgi:hypothetical protein
LNAINLEQYNTFNLITPRTIVHPLYQGEVLPTPPYILTVKPNFLL